jgi:heptose I phosphotransferase
VICSTSGEVAKQAGNRKTLRFQTQDRAFYLKIHAGIGWREIFKNLVMCKMPVFGAGVEWAALHTVRALGVHTVTPAGYGSKGLSPARQRSFLLTEDLGESITLESLLKAWAGRTNLSRNEIRLKRAVIRGTAQLVKRLHSHSVIHRDLYLCHIRIRTEDLAHQIRERCPPLYLMDLHRTQVRTFRRTRWIVKDLGSLYFSALHIGLSKADRFRFIREYSLHTVREELFRRGLWKRVADRAKRTRHIPLSHTKESATS